MSVAASAPSSANTARRAEPPWFHVHTVADRTAEDLIRVLRLGFAVGVVRSRGPVPTTAGVLAFLRRWPAMRAHGRVEYLGSSRPRLVVEGIECDLEGHSANHRAALRSDFECFCRHATDYIDTVEYLYARWT